MRVHMSGAVCDGSAATLEEHDATGEAAVSAARKRGMATKKDFMVLNSVTCVVCIVWTWRDVGVCRGVSSIRSERVLSNLYSNSNTLAWSGVTRVQPIKGGQL